jgi:diadenylate cyclase
MGTEGRLIRLQMEEILTDLEEELIFIIKDYSINREIKPQDVINRLQAISGSEVIEDIVILKMLGYQGYVPLDEFKSPRGYRILNKIPRLPAVIIENLVKRFEQLPNMLAASVEDLDDVEGIGEVRARKIKEGFKLIKERLFTGRLL